MNAVGRIGLLIPEINSSLDHEFVSSVYEQAKVLGFDVIVYTGIFNSIRQLRFDAYIAGLENIYTLVCTQKLDGIIYAAEHFHTDEVVDKIYDYLSQTDTPCLVLGKESEKFSTMEADEYPAVYDITDHLIKKHGCRKLYCIAGVPGHRSSEERLRGFKDACADSGIELSEKDIFYGYFWKIVPEQVGLDIVENRMERPDAVVCANDVMAASLIKTLTANEIRVPEDIAVTSFDGSWDSVDCVSTISTIQGRDKKFGADCICRLYEMIKGEKCENIGIKQEIRYGRSCGCSVLDNDSFLLEEYVKDMMQKNIEKHKFESTDPITGMLNKRSFLNSFPETVNRYILDEKRSSLMLISYYPNQIGAIDLSLVIVDIIENHCYNCLCAKIRERLFAIVLPIEDDENETKKAEEIAAFIEESLCERFAVQQIPEFVINTSEIATSEISFAEKILDADVAKILDKVKALPNNSFRACYTDTWNDCKHINLADVFDSNENAIIPPEEIQNNTNYKT